MVKRRKIRRRLGTNGAEVARGLERGREEDKGEKEGIGKVRGLDQRTLTFQPGEDRARYTNYAKNLQEKQP